MIEPFLVALVIINLAQLAFLMWRPERVIEFPTLVSLSICGLIVPQVFYLIQQDALPPEAFSDFLALVIVSQIMAMLGWYLGKAKAFLHLFENVRAERMLYVIAAIGLFFTVWLRSLPASVLMQSQWSGLPVVLNFFASSNTFAFILALALYLQTRKQTFAVIMLVTALPLADRVFVLFRREDAVTVFVAIMAGLLMFRNWRPPRVALALALFVGIALVNSAGAYRSATFQYTEVGRSVSFDNYFERVFSIDGLTKFFTSDTGSFDLRVAPEVTNAVLEIEAIQEDGRYTHGASIVNKLIQDFVPSSFFGMTIDKRSWFIGEDVSRPTIPIERLNGSTSTGFADVFASFGLFGAVVFLGIAYFAARLHATAVQGSPIALLWYVAVTVAGLKVVSHNMGGFASECLYLLLLTAPFLSSGRRNSTTPAPAVR